MKLRPQHLALAAAAVFLGSGCRGLTPLAFEAEPFAPNPTAVGSADPAQLASTVAAMTPMLAIVEQDHQMLLMGTPRLDAGSGEALKINLRQEGSGYRSPCSYWFRVPIDPAAWEVSQAKMFRVRFDPAEYEVDEACGSPFSADVPMILTFREAGQGAQFMNAMAALKDSGPPVPAASYAFQQR